MRVGSLTTLRRARPAGWATLLVCASGALILPGLHVLEHLHEQQEDEEAAVAAALEAPGGHGARTPHHTHTHDPDGSRHEDDDDDEGGPVPGHGRGALSHLGVLLAPTATFVFVPAHAVRSALAVAPLRTRAIVSVLFPTRSPRGPPAPVSTQNTSHS